MRITRELRQTSSKGSVTVIRTNGWKGKVHIFVSPQQTNLSHIIFKKGSKRRDKMPEYRKNPRAKVVMTQKGSVMSRTHKRPERVRTLSNSRRDPAITRQDVGPKMEIQYGLQYTERRIIKELDDVIRSGTTLPYNSSQKGSYGPKSQRVRTYPGETQASLKKAKKTKNQSSLEVGKKVTEGQAVSMPSNLHEIKKNFMDLQQINGSKDGKPGEHTGPGTSDRVVFPIPECVRRLRLHYQSAKAVEEQEVEAESDNDSVFVDQDEQLKFKMEYWNRSIKRQMPLPYLRESDSKTNTASYRRKSNLKNTVSRMTAFMTQRKPFGQIPDADGTPISPGDCVWISKPYLSIAIYVGKRSIVRCVATHIVKELVDPFQTIWKATFSGGDALILPKDHIMRTAKRRVGETFIGTNMEFIVNCLTNLESLEAHELGFRLLDEKGEETNFHLAEVF